MHNKKIHILVITLSLAVLLTSMSALTLAQNAPGYNIPDSTPKPKAATPAPAPKPGTGQTKNIPSYGENSAQTQSEPVPEGQENVFCQAQMKAFLDTEFAEYGKFLDTHFQNKSSTATLLDDAFAHYRGFRDDVMNKYATFSPQNGALQLLESVDADSCQKMVEDTLGAARQMLMRLATSTSGVKKTTALITKYQQINDKLRLLQQNFLTMKAYLDTFATKLPCYVKKSCNKG